ncbi:RDD family protein [Streptomyces sp. NPDC005865]|uniref:RDD family protein n=1 Tax=Streptomyces sp. NPDC005865 TaxID=3155453 RepID=UPI0033CD9F36
MLARSYDMTYPYPPPPESTPHGPYGYPAAQPPISEPPQQYLNPQYPQHPQYPQGQYPQYPQYPHPQSPHPQHTPYPQYPHSQNPEYTPYAGWGQRAGAFLLDCVINFGPLWLFMEAADVIGDGNTGEGPALYVSWMGIAYMIGACIAQAIREGRTGQSAGKTVLDIRVVRASDGHAPGGPLAFARRLCQFLNFPALCLGWLWASWDPKAQTFADKITGAVVISADAAVAPHPGAASW